MCYWLLNISRTVNPFRNLLCFSSFFCVGVVAAHELYCFMLWCVFSFHLWVIITFSCMHWETICFNLFFLCYNSISHIVVGQGMSEGKRASYHCNYCSKDISGKIRTKCVVCPDFDLCIECFSIGAEVTPHVCFHPYRVMVCNLIYGLIFSVISVFLLCYALSWMVN